MAASDKKVPGNYHALYEPSVRALRGAAPEAAVAAPRQAVERLSDSVKDLSVEVDAATRMPVSIRSRAAGARLSAAEESPEAAIKEFVKGRADLWNLADADADTLEVQSVSRQGLPTVRLVQRIDGVEVFQGELKGALDDGQPAGLGHRPGVLGRGGGLEPPGGRPPGPGRDDDAGVGDREGGERPDRGRVCGEGLQGRGRAGGGRPLSPVCVQAREDRTSGPGSSAPSASRT